MEELQTITNLVDAGGSIALLVAVYYIRENTKADRAVAERLARIESRLNLETKQE